MYEELTIENLRGITALTVKELRPINLIVGRNNTGKSTLMESLFLMGGATNPYQPITLAQLRGQRLGRSQPDPLWRPLFRDLNPRNVIEIGSKWAGETRNRTLSIEALHVRNYADSMDQSPGDDTGFAAVTQSFVVGGLRLRYVNGDGVEITTNAIFDPRTRTIQAPSEDRDDFVRTTLLSARSYSSLARDAQQFSFLVKIKQESDVLEAVRILEPRIERIEVLSEAGVPSLYLDAGLDSLVPLAVGGEGMVRLFSIIVELTASRHGVLLIDEIDNGLHYSVMPRLWQLLGQLVEKHDVQIFATTHNDDMMRSALEAFAGKEGMLGLFRIDKRGDRHVMVSYSEEAMKGILEDHFEVRG